MTTSQRVTSSNPALPSGRIVDLSHALRPGKERYTVEIAHRRDRTTPTTKMQDAIYMWSHAGTHIEAPLHYIAGGGDVASLPLAAMVGPAIVLDFSHKGMREPISRDEIRAAGDIAVGDRVLLRVGADALYRTPDALQGAYPTEEACRWLIDDRGIVLLGTDSGNFDVPGDKTSPNHRILLEEAGIPVIECLNNLAELRRQRVFLVAVPLPILGCDASPVRAFAIEPD